LTGKTLEELSAEWRAARDELRAFEQRLGVLPQEMDDKDVQAPDLPLDARECRGASAFGGERKATRRRLHGPLK
jgi:hypothetical protein